MRIKILIPKQMLQRLLISLTQIKFQVTQLKTYLMKSVNIFFVPSKGN